MLVLALSALGAASSASATVDAVAAGHHVTAPAHGWRAPDTSPPGHFQNWERSGKALRCLGINKGEQLSWGVVSGCVDNPDQEWKTGNPVTQGFYRIYNGYGKCLGTSHGHTTVGTWVVAANCANGHNDQLWMFGGNGTIPCGQNNSFMPISNLKAGGLVIGTSHGSMTSGTHLVITHWETGCTNQDWKHTLG